MSFDWQTDEENWKPEMDTAVADTASQRNWFKVAAVVTVLLVLGLIGWGIIYGQAQRRVEAAVIGLEEEVAAANALMQKSTVSGDLALFELTLLPANKWREMQMDLLAHQLFWNRSALGLWLDLTRFDPEVVAPATFDFAPDLQSVTTTSVLPYVIAGEGEALQPVQLQRTVAFRRVNNQWQLAPFPAGFWGEEDEINGRYLTIEVPVRDAEIGTRLARDLDALIGRACDLPDFDCPENIQVELVFEIDPASSFVLNQGYRIKTVYRSDVGRVMQIRMPTPTLVGLPLGEAGYQALYRGYGAQLLTRIIANLDSNCCSFGPNIPSPFALHLDALGLNPPRPPEYHPQRELMETPVPLPDQDIVALCQEGSVSTLFRYDPLTASWQTEYEGDSGFFSEMEPVAGNGVLIATFPSLTSSTWQLLWIENGRAEEIVQSDEGLYLLRVFPYWEADSRDSVILYVESEGDDWVEHMIRVDLDTCATTSGCAVEELAHLPVFSPEGTHSILRSLRSSQNIVSFDYWLGNAAGEPLVSLGSVRGFSWFDEETLLLLDHTADSKGTTLLRAAVENERGLGEREVLLTSDAANQFLIRYGIEGDFAIGGVVSDGEGMDNELLIFMVQMEDGGSTYLGYLLEFDVASGQLDWMEPFAQMPLLLDIGYSPNGRYLYATSEVDSIQRLRLLDLETGEVQDHELSQGWRGIDWSEDSEWLVVVGEDALSLIAPSVNFVRKVFYGMTDCNTAVWVDQPTVPAD